MVLFWRVTSGKKYLKIFGSLGGLWQVVKLGKTRYFKNFENLLSIVLGGKVGQKIFFSENFFDKI